MEVRIDAKAGLDAPSDTFVSMRIGEVQKQSRFADSRTYRFPAPAKGQGNFGRIEVFKRIGHLTVKFDDMDGSAKDVTVPVDVPGLKNLALSLSVKGGGTETLPQLKANSTKRAKQRKDAAQRYLDDHNLEDTLADAMKELIHTKPRDPHAFLSNLILRRSRRAQDPAAGAGLPALHGASSMPELPPASPSFGKQRSRPNTRDKLPALAGNRSTLQPKALAPLAPLPTAVGSAQPQDFAGYYRQNVVVSQAPAGFYDKFGGGKPQATLAQFSAYFSENFASLRPSDLQGLYSKFPAPPRVTFKTPVKQSTLNEWKGYFKENFVGSRTTDVPGMFANFKKPPRVLFAAKRATLADFGAYWRQNFVSVTPGSLEGLFSKFPAAPVVRFKASSGPAAYWKQNFAALPPPRALQGLYQKFPGAAAAARPSDGESAFARTPSVGSWIARPAPKLWAPPAITTEAEVPVPPLRGPQFTRLPSVGTWLSKPRSRPAVEAQPPAPAAAAKVPDFVFKPSVGSWLAHRPKAPSATTSPSASSSAHDLNAFRFKPSVGSWLQVQLKTSAPAPASSGPGAASSAAPARPWALNPSVGTWLQLAPAPQPEAAWNLRPSVGTWLAPAPPADQQATVVRSVSERRPSEIETMSKEELFSTMKSEVVAKDQEIAELKKQLERLKMPGGLQ